MLAQVARRSALSGLDLFRIALLRVTQYASFVQKVLSVTYLIYPHAFRIEHLADLEQFSRQEIARRMQRARALMKNLEMLTLL